MHPPHVREAAMELIRAGINDCEISRRLGIPRATIRDWRRPTYVPRREVARETCWRCGRASKPTRLSSEDYAELLGFYLGDGCISPSARTQRLRIALDAKYPAIISACSSLLGRVFPRIQLDWSSTWRNHVRRLGVLESPRLRSPTARAWSQASAANRVGALAGAVRRGRPLGLHPILYLDRRLRFRQPNGAIRVSLLRLHEHVQGLR